LRTLVAPRRKTDPLPRGLACAASGLFNYRNETVKLLPND